MDFLNFLLNYILAGVPSVAWSLFSQHNLRSVNLFLILDVLHHFGQANSVV